MAPPEFRPRAIPSRYVNMDILPLSGIDERREHTISGRGDGGGDRDFHRAGAREW